MYYYQGNFETTKEPPFRTIISDLNPNHWIVESVKILSVHCTIKIALPLVLPIQKVRANMSDIHETWSSRKGTKISWLMIYQ